MVSTSLSEPRFDIKLLSGKTVVMVECPGYETELFMPQIVKGRITFQNIIPNRRCCPESSMLPREDKRGAAAVRGARSTPLRLSQTVNLSTPLAKSTPSSGSTVHSRVGKENIPPHLTPELGRCRPVRMPSLDDCDLNLDLVCASSPEPQVVPACRNLNLEARISPLPACSYNLATVQTKEPVLSRTPPVRTYSRKKAATPSKTKPTVWSPLQKKRKTSTVSSTKGLSPTVKVVMRSRKLIVDNKKTLEPRDLKKITPISREMITRKQVTGKTRNQFKALKVTAFDLLTQPALGIMGHELNTQFEQACVNKKATTLPNYAEVAVTEPLKMDYQVKTLLAKQRRMERDDQQKPKCAMMPKSKTKVWSF
ncbi:uncharacterized protein uno [Drosophila kikkawai]|uniref:Uncharacterized protein uno n=1 Tax=Drosophila kikkawai TaxID=30033 RepID=A0A6P4IFH8_DROKI|nr:uncharacterized protein LOC108078359 [Drosophila kikkawai]